MFNKIPIFQDSIITGSVIDKELDKTISMVLQNEIKENQGNFLSNKGGYQTRNINDDKICNTLLKESSEIIIKNYNLTNVKTTMYNLWINKNYEGNYNSPHTHPMSFFSGIYYLDVSEKGGDLILFRGNRSNQIPDIHNILTNPDFRVEYHLKPLKHQLIVFPSHLLHMVTPHFDKRARISVSFNISIKENG
jgi:uncharacterized protein (TIGR02466 family)|tara:strand:+ start:3252 stop:3827 length:576 start_codon:yes stop_codon:yes gene_type:complete